MSPNADAKEPIDLENLSADAIRRSTDFADRRVCVAPCEDYDLDRLDAIVEEQCEALGLSDYITEGCRVVIKPNLVIKRRPEEASTTHPALVAAVIRAAKRRGAGSVIIAESSGGLYNKAAMSAIYATCGIAEVCEREGAELNFDFGSVPVNHPEALLSHHFGIITPVVNADVLINIGKLKTHCMTGLSGASKNLFGCMPGLSKPEMHCQYPDKSDFAQMLVDLCTLVRPQLSFLDAIDCMEGDGPTGGQKRHVGAVLAGRNPFAVDVTACALINLKPESIYMLRHAAERGLGPASLDGVELLGSLEGLVVSDFKKPRSRNTDFLDFLPSFLRPLARRSESILSPRPAINKNKCVGCGKCAESCPQHTITIANKRAEIDYKNCIRCYCCHEMCPIRAIDVKRKSVFKI